MIKREKTTYCCQASFGHNGYFSEEGWFWIGGAANLRAARGFCEDWIREELQEKRIKPDSGVRLRIIVNDPEEEVFIIIVPTGPKPIEST